MNFSIIIVNYNLSQEICVCIDSIYKHLNTDDFEVIIFDNNSEKSEINLLNKKIYTINSNNISLILNEKNIGFGQACNQASLKASGKILFFLNPDTIIVENIFRSIRDEFGNEIFDDKLIGLNVDQHKMIDYSAGYFPNVFFETLNILLLGRIFEASGMKIKSIFSIKNKIEVDWVMGAAFFISKELFIKIGGFDPDYFLYFEEVDLCKRVKKNGFKVYYLPKIKVLHDGSVSTKKNYYFFTKLFYKGKLIFLQKFSNAKKFFLFKLLLKINFNNQIFFWSLLRSKFPDKASGKIKAFKELKLFIDNTKSISNYNS